MRERAGYSTSEVPERSQWLSAENVGSIINSSGLVSFAAHIPNAALNEKAPAPRTIIVIASKMYSTSGSYAEAFAPIR